MISDAISNDEIPTAPTFGPIQNSKRLIVDHIVLENFKSYAGRQVIGPFHQVIKNNAKVVYFRFWPCIEFYFNCRP